MKIIMTIIWLCLLSTAGWAQGAGPVASSPAIGPEACCSPSDPARPITVGKGEIFALTLPSNPTTGYTWQLAETPDGGFIQFIGNKYRSDKTGRAGLVGAGGREIWTFKAVASGETAIGLKYVRPWEKNTAPARSVLFKIIVGGNENRK